MWAFFFLLLSSCMATEVIQVEPISGPVYLEHLGDVVMFHKTWTIVNYVDLTEINTQRDELFNAAEKLRIVCDYEQPEKKCIESVTIGTVYQRLRRIDHSRVRLMNIINYTPRVKRGIFNSIGDISKVLFGTNKVTISGNCIGQTDHIVIRPRLEEKIIQTTDVMVNKTFHTPKLDDILNNHSVSLEDFKLTTLGRPTHLDVTQLKSLGLTLDEISDEAEKIGRHRRNKTLLETVYDGVKYFGYACICIVILFIACKIGLCTCLADLIRKLISCTFSPCINVYNNCFHTNTTDNVNYNVRHPQGELLALTNLSEPFDTQSTVRHTVRRNLYHPKA